ncbi:MAG: antibiotic biosynthesis monooxygenase [Lachnospiraceae bacterium]|nr:antibiotic biosynthesis monooxygenase [Lachnospiraceae bacterium]
MYKIVARMTIKKEKIDEFKKTAADLIKKSRAEAGNMFYTLNQDTKDTQKFAFIECWKDDEAMKLHGASEHFTSTFPVLSAMAESSEPMELYKEIEF